MPTLSSITSFAVNDPLSPSHLNSKFDVLVSNISLVNAASSVTANSGLSGSGVTNYLPLWSGATSLVTSLASQNGSVIGVAGIVSMTSYLVVHSSITSAARGTIRLGVGASCFARKMDNSADVAIFSHDSVNNRVYLASSVTGGQASAVVFNNDMFWATDGTYTIGSSTDLRPRRMYLSDYVVVGNNAGSGSKGAFIAGYRDDVVAARNSSNNSDIVMWGVNSTNEIKQGTTLNSFDLIIKRPVLQDYAEAVYAFGSISANTVASLESGNVFTATATSNVSFQLVNAPASPNAGSATFHLTASGSTRTFSFLSVGFGAQGNPPGIPNGTKMLVNTITIDGGLTYLGSYATGYT